MMINDRHNMVGQSNNYRIIKKGKAEDTVLTVLWLTELAECVSFCVIEIESYLQQSLYESTKPSGEYKRNVDRANYEIRSHVCTL